MPNVIRVTKQCTVTVTGVTPRVFVVNEEVMPGSPFYQALLWSGNAIDTGNRAPTLDPVLATIPSTLVVSNNDPKLGVPGLWLKPEGAGYKMYYIDPTGFAGQLNLQAVDNGLVVVPLGDGRYEIRASAGASITPLGDGRYRIEG